METSDKAMLHRTDIAAYTMQKMAYKSQGELARLAAFLDHPTINVHRRGSLMLSDIGL